MLNICLKVLGIILIFLILCNLFIFLITEETSWDYETSVLFGFEQMLVEFENCPQIEFNYHDMYNKMTITNDWGVFNFFRDYLNMCSLAISYIVWTFTLGANLIIGVGYFLYLLGFNGTYYSS